MVNAKIQCWSKTHKKKWRLALRIATSPSERWLQKAAEWNSELSSKYRPTERLGDQETDGKMTPTKSSNLLRTRQKTFLKAAAKSTKHGSTQQKTAEDGLYSKKKTQWLQKNDLKIMREWSKPTSEIRQRSETERRRSGQHHITQSLKKTKVKSEMKILKDAGAPQSVPHASPKWIFRKWTRYHSVTHESSPDKHLWARIDGALSSGTSWLESGLGTCRWNLTSVTLDGCRTAQPCTQGFTEQVCTLRTRVCSCTRACSCACTQTQSSSFFDFQSSRRFPRRWVSGSLHYFSHFRSVRFTLTFRSIQSRFVSIFWW